jgi:hypothetical protein
MLQFHTSKHFVMHYTLTTPSIAKKGDGTPITGDRRPHFGTGCNNATHFSNSSISTHPSVVNIMKHVL